MYFFVDIFFKDSFLYWPELSTLDLKFIFHLIIDSIFQVGSNVNSNKKQKKLPMINFNAVSFNPTYSMK